MGEIVRWSLTVSKETDIALRTLLAQRGMKKGDLSKFIEDSVKWRIFEDNLAETRSKFADLAADDIQALIDEAVSETRKARA